MLKRYKFTLIWSKCQIR